MRKKVVAVLLSTVTVIGLFAGCGGSSDSGNSGTESAEEGKVINIYSWNDEFRTRLEAIYPEVESTSDDGTVTTLKDGTEIHWVINPNQDGVYQQKLDEALLNQADAAADDKVDIFLSETDYVYKEIESYWGGMLKEGATSFWEVYNPDEKGAQHTAMYGRPFGRSFCHSWGATALYIFGRHFAGVKPLTPGYETFEIAPHLSDLDWIKAKVPTPNGDIALNVTKKSIEVESPGGVGYLRFESKSEPKCAQGEIKKTSANSYELEILPNKKYAVTYEK